MGRRGKREVGVIISGQQEGLLCYWKMVMSLCVLTVLVAVSCALTPPFLFSCPLNLPRKMLGRDLAKDMISPWF